MGKDTSQKQHDPLRPSTRDAGDVLKELDVSPETGLTDKEVKDRCRRHGENRLEEKGRKHILVILVNQFESLVILLLVAASAVAFIFGNRIEGIAIGAAIIINTAIGFFTELKAVRMMEALKEMGKVSTKVRRNETIKEVPAEKIVPGDIVIIEGGDIVTADLRLLEASNLQVDESALTGESVPVTKDTDALEGELPVAERTNMLFKGTSVTAGSGEGVVTSTGMNTELGHIASLVEEAGEETTPLEKRLNRLGQRLIWITIAIAALVAVTGIAAGREIFIMVEVSIALAIAAIPEGLPIVATVALARGMLRMAARNALVNRLSAVETLGATNIIFTDKTGTLTENRLMVKRFSSASGDIDVGTEESGGGTFTKDGKPFDPGDDSVLTEALKTGVLCSNASLHRTAEDRDGDDLKGTGDPLEIALLAAGDRAGFRRDDLLEKMPEVREEAFHTETKMMATFHEAGGEYHVAVKGAPEAVLEACTHVLAPDGKRSMNDTELEEWSKRNEGMAEDGMRVLALATKTVQSGDEDPYRELALVSLVGLIDPPRREVAESIALSRRAGIRVVMVTGDQSVTARVVGRSVGILDEEDTGREPIMHGSDLRDPDRLSEQEQRQLLETRIFSRVNPEQKLDLIALHQKNHAVVAMTGDGVNDAPALKKADIGIAMGKRGTQVAREAADMVLKDDAFSTIVAAVEHGRLIFNNIRKFVLFLLSGNVSEIIAVSAATVAALPLPILPLQILFLNMVIDVFPALALGLGEGDSGVMGRPPRDPKEPVMTRNHWLAILGYGLLIGMTVLGALGLALFWLGLNGSDAVTVSFLTLSFARLWHVFNMRDRGSNFLYNDITRNRYVWGALALCAGLILSTVYVPFLSALLKVSHPPVEGWTVIAVMSLVPFVAGQTMKLRIQTRSGDSH